MKKIFTVLALCFAFAAHAETAGVTTEFEIEKGKNGGADSKSVSVAPYIKLGNGLKLDVKFEGGRDGGSVAGENHPLESKVEARVRKDIKLTDNVSVGLRLGVGEVLAARDFSYYTIEPMVGLKAAKELSFNTSYRYRNAFDTDNHFKTNTFKVGTAYKVTEQDEVGLKYFEKYGDSRSNGVEFVYSRGF